MAYWKEKKNSECIYEQLGKTEIVTRSFDIPLDIGSSISLKIPEDTLLKRPAKIFPSSK